MGRRICILGTHHDYQYCAPRQAYLQNVRDLISIHHVDLVAEEASGISDTSYARRLVKAEFESCASWKNVDLTAEERVNVPDINPHGIGTLQDLDFHTLREWVWVVRTSKGMRDSALLICGFAHMFSVAEKFQITGFKIEINAYFDKRDLPRCNNVI